MDNVFGEDSDSCGFGSAAMADDDKHVLAVVAMRFPADQAHQVDRIMRRLMEEFNGVSAVDTGEFASH